MAATRRRDHRERRWRNRMARAMSRGSTLTTAEARAWLVSEYTPGAFYLRRRRDAERRRTCSVLYEVDLDIY